MARLDQFRQASAEADAERRRQHAIGADMASAIINWVHGLDAIDSDLAAIHAELRDADPLGAAQLDAEYRDALLTVERACAMRYGATRKTAQRLRNDVVRDHQWDSPKDYVVRQALTVESFDETSVEVVPDMTRADTALRLIGNWERSEVERARTASGSAALVAREAHGRAMSGAGYGRIPQQGIRSAMQLGEVALRLLPAEAVTAIRHAAEHLSPSVTSPGVVRREFADPFDRDEAQSERNRALDVLRGIASGPEN